MVLLRQTGIIEDQSGCIPSIQMLGEDVVARMMPASFGVDASPDFASAFAQRGSIDILDEEATIKTHSAGRQLRLNLVYNRDFAADFFGEL